ncbi:hypothetical protein [Streptomyces hokutonensis]|uniref:hypothetical protein n=1 Tax=Streptomyces hokutonensis TaxID=1306990 RepID=UPI003676E696
MDVEIPALVRDTAAGFGAGAPYALKAVAGQLADDPEMGVSSQLPGIRTVLVDGELFEDCPALAVGYLRVAYERQGAQPAGLAVAQHIATVAALRLAMVRNERETLRREGAETSAELLQEVLDPEAARRRIARHAIDGDTVLLVVRHTTDEALLRCRTTPICCSPGARTAMSWARRS